jgi:hypothetical protein
MHCHRNPKAFEVVNILEGHRDIENYFADDKR